MTNANKYSLQKAKSLDDLATLICGYGYYAHHKDDRDHPIPKEAVKEYLEVGAAFQMRETEPKLQKLKRLADAMYTASQYLTTDASRLHKAMEEYHQFIINELQRMDKDKQLVSYPVEEAEFRPVISIGGREYVVMPYEKIVVLPQEVVDEGALHPERDSRAFNMNSHAESLLADIVEYLRDAAAVTAVDEGKHEDRHDYRLMLPVLMPIDTNERWRRGWTPEREEEFRNALIERRKTGKPYIFKMVEGKEE